MPRLLPVLLIVAALWPHDAAAQAPSPGPVPLFNGRSLAGWKTERAKAGVENGVIQIRSSKGWLRTERVLADFVVSLDVRMLKGGTAGVYLRGWPRLNENAVPASAHRLRVSFPETAVGWSHWEIECIGRTVTMRVDGRAAYTFDGVRNPQGHLGLWAQDGTAEFKSIEIREVGLPVTGDPAGVATPKTPGAAIPRLLKEVKPSYTRQAMEQKIEGIVWIGAIVGVDGAVEDMKIYRSLDPDFGLDRSALAAAAQWKFTPPTVDGKPARMLVTIELAFTLK